MNQARDDSRGEVSAHAPGVPAATPSEEMSQTRQPVIELKPFLTHEGLADARGPFQAGALTLMRVVSGALRREAGLIDPTAVFGDEDEDYDDDFDDEDDEDEEDDLDEEDEDDEEDEEDEFDDEDDEDDDEFDEIDDEEEDEFEADLDDD